MSSKKCGDDDYHLIRRCMAIVLSLSSDGLSERSGFQKVSDRTRTNSSTSLGLELCTGISEGPGPPFDEGPKAGPGPGVFRDFVKENSECFWNPNLVQSVSNLEYRGCISPSTLLISGSEYSLEVMRSAWARRMLRAPSGYDITKMGDLDPVKMSIVAQTQFAPLPEALCKVVYDLNNEGTETSISVIGSRLRATFPEIVFPEKDVLYRTLGTLIRERKLFHTGQGYSVVTPETFRLLAMSPPLQRQMLLTNDEAIIRLHGTAVTEGRTACTQTNQKDRTLSTWSSAERILAPRGKLHHSKLKRCHSLKLLQRGRDKEKIFRSNSFRSSKASPGRESRSDAEINHAIKKEKPSVFSKLFRRGREKKIPIPKSSSFSAQFPPQDKADPDFVHFNSRATQTMDKNESLLPPKPNKSRSNSLNRTSNRDRNSYYLASSPVTPKAAQRNGRCPQPSDIYHYRSSSLPRKSSPSPKRESSRNSNHLTTRKPSPKPPSRQRHCHQNNIETRVPVTTPPKNKPNYESSFSPLQRDELLVCADDKYDDVKPITPRNIWTYGQNGRNLDLKLPSSPALLRNPIQPWRTISTSTPYSQPRLNIPEPLKLLPIGLPQRIVSNDLTNGTSSTSTPIIKPQVEKTISENTVITETTTTTSSPKKSVQIDGSVDVEVNIGQLLSGKNKTGTPNAIGIQPKNDLLKIAASWNQSVTNVPKTTVSDITNSHNQTLSTSTSITTSVTHTGGLKNIAVKPKPAENSIVNPVPLKVIKSTAVYDHIGKCSVVNDAPKSPVSCSSSSSSSGNLRSKLADAKRDFFADSPCPTEPVSLKDDSGFSSSASTSRPMSVSPC